MDVHMAAAGGFAIGAATGAFLSWWGDRKTTPLIPLLNKEGSPKGGVAERPSLCDYSSEIAGIDEEELGKWEKEKSKKGRRVR